MATNSILQFGAAASNELNDADYLADAQRLSGNQPGVARSPLVNKALHQATLITAGLAGLLAARQATNITDALTAAQVTTILGNVFGGAGSGSTSGWKPIGDGYILQWGQASIGGASTSLVVSLPTSFPTAGLFALASDSGNTCWGASASIPSTTQITVYCSPYSSNTGALVAKSTSAALRWIAIGN